MKSILFSLCAFFCLTAVTAQTSVNRLTVLHPDQGLWSDGDDAFFESIDVTITPQTSYAEVDIDLELSAKYSNYEDHEDSLELLFKFILPSGVIMNDAWLWMDGIPIQAELFEKGEAQVIYESFVIRRTDPLIIYKDGNAYEARIFPLVNPGSRRVKFSLIIPTTQNAKGTFVDIPFDIFVKNAGPNFSQDIKVTITDIEKWGRPELSSLTKLISDDKQLVYSMLNQSGSAALNSVLHFPENKPENAFNLYVDDVLGEKFFELIIKDTVRPKKGRKYLIVFDHVTAKNEYISAYSWAQFIKNQLFSILTDLDSFNFMYTAGDSPHLYSPGWISADSVSFEYALNGLPQHQKVTAKPNTVMLMTDAIDFINENGSEGIIFALTTTEAVSVSNDVRSINKLSNDLVDQMNSNYPVISAELNDRLDYTFNQNGTNSYNNHQFWSNLANNTKGLAVKRFLIDQETNWWWRFDYKTLPIEYVINECFKYIQHHYDFVSFKYDFGQGILYNDHFIGKSSLVNSGDALTIIGQYFGNVDDSISVELATSVDGSIYRTDVHLNGKYGVETIKQFWAGNHLNSLITPNITPAEKALVVNKSIEYNVLTDFTAFLALEPDSMIMSFTFRDFPLVSTKDINSEVIDFAPIAYPNPFTNTLALKLACNSADIGKHYNVEVVDLLGRTLFTHSGRIDGLETQVNLTQQSLALSKGMYLIKVRLDGLEKSIRVIKE